MSATFNASLTTFKDHIRLAVGDTDMTVPLLQDETINAKLVVYGYCEGLAQCCDALGTLYAQRPSLYNEAGGVYAMWQYRVKAWQDLAALARAGKIAPPVLTAHNHVSVQPLTVQASVEGDTGVMEKFRST